MKYSKLLVLAVLVFLTSASFGQTLLSKPVTLQVSQQRLEDVLEILSNKGNFYFSYNSTIVKKDSLVSFRVSNKTINEILRSLFNDTYEFIESGDYIIIRKVPIRMLMVTKKAELEERIYSVSGFVYDELSGVAIHEASIYEKRLLSSALTNDDGYFKIKLKSGKASAVQLTVSKEFYEDTTVVIEPRHSQELTITMQPVEREGTTTIITPRDYLLADSLKPTFDIDISKPILSVKRDSGRVEKTGMGRFLLSAKQKAQSLNLKSFFTSRPFQLGLIPGVSTHGKLGAQVVNNFSLNTFGGYTAGTNGVEIGGLFNIDKKDVKYVQVGGIFNVVGGALTGVQIAGVNNTVFDSVRGFQVGGISNLVKGKFSGFQVAGIYNHVTDSVKGLLVGGIGNFARKKVSGAQIAGIANFSNREMDGAQIAGIINYSKRLKGVQIGLINISDTSEGYSIGLINIVLKGYHKISFYTNEVTAVNAAFKTGNSKLYSILHAGLSSGKDKKIYAFGYGLGSEITLNKAKSLSLNPELTSEYLYMGSWDFTNILNKAYVNLNVKLNKYVSLFAGPSYAVYISDQKTGIAGYRFPIPPAGYKTNSFSNKVSGWFGWNAGINFL